MINSNTKKSTRYKISPGKKKNTTITKLSESIPNHSDLNRRIQQLQLQK